MTNINDDACASSDAQESALGVLLSQMLTSRAFPEAAAEDDTQQAAMLLEGVLNESDDLRGIVVSPGLIRVVGHRAGGRSGGGTRGAISGFSQSSRRQMLRRLGALDLSVVQGIPVVVTLTYPADWREWCPTGRDAKDQLLSFRRRWARRWGDFQGVWKLEFQPRHSQPLERRLAPHFHILGVVPAVDLSKPVPQATSMTEVREWVSETWWEVVGSANADHLKVGTRVDEADGDNPGRVVAYFAGYTAGKSKEEQHVSPDNWSGVGRYWGVVGIPSVELEVQLSPEDFFAVRRVLADLLARRSGARRRSLRREDDGLWLAYNNAPDLVRRLAEWLRPTPHNGPRPLP
jgi:hypothetical protein